MLTYPDFDIGPYELDHDDEEKGCFNRACVNPDHLVVLWPWQHSQRTRLREGPRY
jgi:hypothetical protein